MEFNMDTAINIGKYLRASDSVITHIPHDDMVNLVQKHQSESAWQLTHGHLRWMEDGGWVDRVEVHAAQMQARLTLAGQRWLEATETPSIKQRIQDAVSKAGIRAGDAVISEVGKKIAESL